MSGGSAIDGGKRKKLQQQQQHHKEEVKKEEEPQQEEGLKGIKDGACSPSHDAEPCEPNPLQHLCSDIEPLLVSVQPPSSVGHQSSSSGSNSSSSSSSISRGSISGVFGRLCGHVPREDRGRVPFLSGILAIIIGGYWLLRSLKDPIFATIVGVEYIPMGKIISLGVVFILVILYNSVIDLFPIHHHLFYLIGGFYFCVFLTIAVLLEHPTMGIANTHSSPSRLLGWVSSCAIDSLGSLLVSLFWAFVNNSMSLGSAKASFGLIIAGAQVGSIIGPTLATQAPRLGIPLLYGMGAFSMVLMCVAICAYDCIFGGGRKRALTAAAAAAAAGTASPPSVSPAAAAAAAAAAATGVGDIATAAVGATEARRSKEGGKMRHTAGVWSFLKGRSDGRYQKLPQQHEQPQQVDDEGVAYVEDGHERRNGVDGGHGRSGGYEQVVGTGEGGMEIEMTQQMESSGLGRNKHQSEPEERGGGRACEASEWADGWEGREGRSQDQGQPSTARAVGDGSEGGGRIGGTKEKGACGSACCSCCSGGGVAEGFMLVRKYHYLKGVFAVSSLFEIEATILDYMLKVMAVTRFAERFPDDPVTATKHFVQLMGRFGQITNSVSLVFSVVATSAVLRTLGLRWTLVLFPSLCICAVGIVVALPELRVVFGAMVALKALQYSLNNPCKELLYQPTSTAVKFKAKSLIDAIGNRGSKAVGAVITHLFTSNLTGLVDYGGVLAMGISSSLVVVSVFLGRTFDFYMKAGIVLGQQDQQQQEEGGKGEEVAEEVEEVLVVGLEEEGVYSSHLSNGEGVELDAEGEECGA